MTVNLYRHDTKYPSDGTNRVSIRTLEMHTEVPLDATLRSAIRTNSYVNYHSIFPLNLSSLKPKAEV